MNISMFDILGPIMIGPSSSHTAGAQRIGKAMYNMIADKQLQAVHFILHGSFHLTLRGHGTDRALVGGVLGMNAYDPQLKNSLEIAKERGIEQLELEVMEGNDRAIRLYEKFGFERFGVRPNAIHLKDGTRPRELLMVKVL